VHNKLAVGATLPCEFPLLSTIRKHIDGRHILPEKSNNQKNSGLKHMGKLVLTGKQPQE